MLFRLINDHSPFDLWFPIETDCLWNSVTKYYYVRLIANTHLYYSRRMFGSDPGRELFASSTVYTICDTDAGGRGASLRIPRETGLRTSRPLCRDLGLERKIRDSCHLELRPVPARCLREFARVSSVQRRP